MKIALRPVIKAMYCTGRFLLAHNGLVFQPVVGYGSEQVLRADVMGCTDLSEMSNGSVS